MNNRSGRLRRRFVGRSSIPQVAFQVSSRVTPRSCRTRRSRGSSRYAEAACTLGTCPAPVSIVRLERPISTVARQTVAEVRIARCHAAIGTIGARSRANSVGRGRFVSVVSQFGQTYATCRPFDSNTQSPSTGLEWSHSQQNSVAFRCVGRRHRGGCWVIERGYRPHKHIS